MKTQIESILIPTDFSILSESALKMGVAIAKRQNAKIILLHIMDRFSFLQPTEVFLPEVQLVPDIKLTIEEKLKDLGEKIQLETGIKMYNKVLIGTPSDTICRLAFTENISLIIMGTHGSSGLREFFIGSEAYRVVKHATCPVLTVPGNWEKTDFEKILFPIRLVPDALDKYFFTRPIIEKNNSELILLGLTEKENPGKLPEIALLMDQIKYQLHIDNVVFQSLLSPCENFASKVIELSNENDTDLIILSSNLDYDFKAFFVGPFVQQIVNHSKRPVLSIKQSNITFEKIGTFSPDESRGKAYDKSDI